MPEDGYVGFYLEKYEETIPPADEYSDPTVQEKDYNLILKNLKAELGDSATTYEKYGYDFYANINVKYIDVNNITYDQNTQNCKYYIRLSSDKGFYQEYEYTYNTKEEINEKRIKTET